MNLTSTSLAKLKGVDPKLVEIVKRAAQLTEQPFQVTCGLRTLEEQKLLVKLGKSHTLKSYHLRGKAVDLVAVVDGKPTYASLEFYRTINKAMQAAAKELGAKITWGATFSKLVDGPHWQIES